VGSSASDQFKEQLIWKNSELGCSRQLVIVRLDLKVSPEERSGGVKIIPWKRRLQCKLLGAGQAELDLIGQTSVHCAKVLAARAQEEELKSGISIPGVFGKAQRKLRRRNNGFEKS
jgi:hypothetical protein